MTSCGLPTRIKASCYVADFIDLSIVKFQLKNDNDDAEDYNVTLLNGKIFDLEVKASSGQNGQLNETSFWLEQGEKSVKINNPFRSAQTDKMTGITAGNNAAVDLGSTGLDDRLIVSPAEGGYFCEGEGDIFLVVRVQGTQVDPAMTDNEARQKIMFHCFGGEYLWFVPGSLPSTQCR